MPESFRFASGPCNVPRYVLDAPYQQAPSRNPGFNFRASSITTCRSPPFFDCDHTHPSQSRHEHHREIQRNPLNSTASTLLQPTVHQIHIEDEPREKRSLVTSTADRPKDSPEPRPPTMSEAYERERQNNSRLDELSAKVSALRGVTIDIYDNARAQDVIDNTVRNPLLSSVPHPAPTIQ